MRKLLLAATLSTGALFACKSEPPKDLAPPAESPLAPAKPASAGARRFMVQTSSNAVTWVMNAPLEKIYGDVPGGVSGEVFVDLTDVTKTTGLVNINISSLELFQQKRDDEKGEYGPKEKVALQNEHARAWLEISADTPEDVRKKNEVVEFKITSVTTAGDKDISKMTGERRTLSAQVTGDLVLHGRKTVKTADVEVTVIYAGEEPTGLVIKTTKPIIVGLEEHDVRPREAFGKLAAKTLSALGNKVASEAPVELNLTARAMP